MNLLEATYTTDSGQKIEIVHGNITHETTDAIVNAANSYLVHGGGVAGAISRAGGAVIQDESDAWVQGHGEVTTGNVAVTSAGRLPNRYVLHAVGPIWRGGFDDEENLLALAVKNTLEKAHELGLTSIAMPAISSGIFGFPKELCAEILLEETLAFFARSPDSSLRVVRMTNFDTPTVTDFLEALEALKTE